MTPYTPEALANIAEATLSDPDAFFRGETMVNEMRYQCSKDACPRKTSGKCF